MASSWLIWAVLSAVFAAATAVLSIVGLRGVDPDTAQLMRTAFVLVTVGAVAALMGRWRGAAAKPAFAPPTRSRVHAPV